MGTHIDHFDQSDVTPTAHSTGTWNIYSEIEDYIHIEHLKDGVGQTIINVFSSEDYNGDIEVCRANANLVAKASELLVLARKLVTVCYDRLAALNDYTEGFKHFWRGLRGGNF